jgi:predicted dehydrogenase
MHALRTVVGAEPVVTTAFAEFAHGVDARTGAALTFPGGVTGALECSMVAAAYAAPLTVIGDEGVLRLDNFVLPHRGARLWLEREGATMEQPWSGPGTYDAQLAHVVEVLTDAAAPLTGGEDAVANVTALERVRTLAIDSGSK